MAWIELHQNLPGHRRTRRVKSILEIDTPTAVGHMCLLWLWALDNAENGSIGGMLNQEIADVCEYKGDADAFIEALVEAGFLTRTENDLLIHDWADYCGRLMERREKNRIRQQNYRERHRETPQDAPPAPPAKPEPEKEPELTPSMKAAAAVTNPGLEKDADPGLAKVMQFYMNRINATPSMTCIEELGQYAKEMEPDVVISALNYAIDEHKTGWSYIRAMLRGYTQRGIRTMDDLRRNNEEFERAKQRREDTHNANNRRNAQKRAGGSAPPPDTDPLRGFHTDA